MYNSNLRRSVLLVLVMLLVGVGLFRLEARPVLAQGGLGAFTYQGRLVKDGAAYTGTCNFTFRIWDAASGGNQLGTDKVVQGVVVNQGIFSLTLDGTGDLAQFAFDGGARWIEIEVLCVGDTAPTSLGRQSLTAVPRAFFAMNAASLNGRNATSFVSRSGDTMTGTLTLPAGGLVVGNTQLVAASSGVGIGTAEPAGLLDVTGPEVGEILDQQQTIATGSRGGMLSVWQSFTPAYEGPLTRLDIRVGNSLGAWTATLNLYEGEGVSGILLASQPVSRSGNAWHSFTLDTPVPLTPGQRYTWQITHPTSFGSISMTSSNPYLEGRNDYLSYSDYLFKSYIIPTRKVIVTNEGWVGIGTSAPSHALAVAGSGVILGRLGVGTGTPAARLDVNGSAHLRGLVGGTGLYVADNGSVGIGTTAPGSRLDVHGTTQLRGSATSTGLYVNSGGNVGIGTTGVGATLTVSGTATMSGDVGIGTTTPTRRLDVNGSARVTGPLDVVGNTSTTGSATVTGSASVGDALAVGNSLTVGAVKPVLIKRFENVGNDANINTLISSTTYQCVAAGWSAAYDIQEGGTNVNMVWTYVSGTTWWLKVQFSSHNNDESPDVDLLCFHVGISDFQGNRSLNQPN